MGNNYGRSLYKEYELVLNENEALQAEVKMLKKQAQLLEKEIAYRQKLEAQLQELKEEQENLIRENLRLQALLNLNGRNSGLPTSKTPINQKKVIPNSRQKTSRTIGGQPGHAKKKLEAFHEEEITENVLHKEDACPYCGGETEETGNDRYKDELDYEVVVIKRRHHFPECRCKACGKRFRKAIPEELKEENQYGSRVKALSLALMNTGNVSVGKVRRMLYGLSEEEINPSEGYIIKLQKKAAKMLQPFLSDLKKHCCSLKLLYRDDTVIFINTARGCLRFYGDEKTALYTARRYKNKEGLDEDGILKLLPPETRVMHDHDRVNYNRDYCFSNIECNVHLLRDLQKTTDNLGHKWSVELKELLEKTNSERNGQLEKGIECFDDGYILEFFREFDRIMVLGMEENKEDYGKYYSTDERALLLRILDYKDNYLSWVTNFEIPFSNNLSERALRGVKSKMKISGQFQSEETAGYYAAVKSYIETCYRNGINEMEALVRLCRGNPYSVDEIYNHTISEA